MADREIIHSAEDVSAFLNIALERGLVVRVDAPTDTAKSDVASADRLASLDRGVFALYRPEWVFGESQFQQIPSGYNKGRYSQSPRVNSTQITAYFGGERVEGEVRRLGAGAISWHDTWYNSRDRTVRPTPPDVKTTFDALMSLLDTGRYLSGGKHKYLVLEGAMRCLQAGAALPPFDYIEWPPPSESDESKKESRS